MSEVFIVYGERKRRWWFGYHHPEVYRICATRDIAEGVITGFRVMGSRSRLYVVAHTVQGVAGL